MFICFAKLQFSHLRNEDIRFNLLGLDMRMKLANGSQKPCQMKNATQMSVFAVIITYSGHQNQWLLKYGNKTAIARLSQTPSRFTILRSCTRKLFVNMNARQVFLVTYAWALETSTAMYLIKQSDDFAKCCSEDIPHMTVRNDSPRGLLHCDVPCYHLSHLTEVSGYFLQQSSRICSFPVGMVVQSSAHSPCQSPGFTPMGWFCLTHIAALEESKEMCGAHQGQKPVWPVNQGTLVLPSLPWYGNRAGPKKSLHLPQNQEGDPNITWSCRFSYTRWATSTPTLLFPSRCLTDEKEEGKLAEK